MNVKINLIHKHVYHYNNTNNIYLRLDFVGCCMEFYLQKKYSRLLQGGRKTKDLMRSRFKLKRRNLIPNAMLLLLYLPYIHTALVFLLLQNIYKYYFQVINKHKIVINCETYKQITDHTHCSRKFAVKQFGRWFRTFYKTFIQDSFVTKNNLAQSSCSCHF